jgi:hypothetical protein
LWRNSADQFQGGVVLKRQIGATALSASLNGGSGNVDVRRDVTRPPGPRARLPAKRPWAH